MKTPHPYAEILRAIADGETVQYAYQSADDGPWKDAITAAVLSCIGSGQSASYYKYRVKPQN